MSIFCNKGCLKRNLQQVLLYEKPKFKWPPQTKSPKPGFKYENKL